MQLINIQTTENLINDVKSIIETSQKQAYKAVNTSLVLRNWYIGKRIYEEELKGNRAEYGREIIKNLSTGLTKEYGKGYTKTNLYSFYLFYKMYPNIFHAVSGKSILTWTHYRSLLKVEDENARSWYEKEAIKEGWSSRQLDRQISTLYYERLLMSKDKNPVIEEANDKLKEIRPEQFIKDPYVLEFLDLKDYPSLKESSLEQALIDNIQKFLLELGSGFCFVARQKLMRYLDEDFYIDLVFYHSILKCYVLIDLKIGKLTPGDIGQMDSYIRMFDDIYKNEDDNPTIGLLLCSIKNEAIAKYSILNDSKNIFASKYQFKLPTLKELENQMIIERKRIEENMNTL